MNVMKNTPNDIASECPWVNQNADVVQWMKCEQ